jgi:cytochrome P450
MVYLAAVLKEALRMFPSVPFIARQFDSDGELGGHPVPKGTEVLVPILSLHNQPSLWNVSVTRRRVL